MTDKKELKKEEVEKVEEKGIVKVTGQSEFGLMPVEQVRQDLQAIKQFQELVRSQMIKDHDYGVIPGTKKPTLLKPGAEKIAKLMKCADLYEIMSEVENWDKPFFAYKVKCRLVSIMDSSKILSEGIGECNSYESKYRYRWAFSNDVPADLDKATLKTKKVHSQKTNKDYLLYRIENDDIFTQVNTFLKMAKKRALVDASLSAGRLSDIFTQDMEDIGPQANGQKSSTVKPAEKSAPTPAANKPADEGKKILPAQIAQIEKMAIKHGFTDKEATDQIARLEKMPVMDISFERGNLLLQTFSNKKATEDYMGIGH